MTTVNDLFDSRYGHSLELNVLELSKGPDAVNFVGRAARKNGVTARVKAIEGIAPAPAGQITVALGGQGGAGMAFLQPFPFYCGRDVMILRPRFLMSKQELLWWAACISANRFRFGFGRQANKTLRDLALPSRDRIPSWVSTCNPDQFEGARASFDQSAPLPLKVETWESFRYDVLFDIKKGQRLTKALMTEGDTPFIGAIDNNNGCRQYVDVEPNHLGNTITVNYNGSVAEAFYQPHPFWASDDVNVLYPKFSLNPFIAMFVCTLIRQERFRFSYGRKWHLDRMASSILQLPVTAAKDPDWIFMENYVKALPYSKNL